MPNSNSAPAVRKPYPDFPLYAHRTHRWAKKVRGTLHYFGSTRGDEDGQKALAKWKEQQDDLRAGRAPRAKDASGFTLRELCNKFLASKRSDQSTGKIAARTFVEYSRICDLLIDAFGRDRLLSDLRPDDFTALHATLATRHKNALSSLGREITMARSVFKFAAESDLIVKSIKFGPKFKVPSKADKRKLRAKKKGKHGLKMFTAEELRKLIDAAPTQLKAMLLLAANGGFGNSDCATLERVDLDLDAGWLDHPRPKTGIDRRIPLWPETAQALRAVVAKRPAAKDPEHADLVFLTRLGQPWVRYDLIEETNDDGKLEISGRADDAIAKATAKLLTDLGLKRPGLSFYALRHGFETIAGGAKDQIAVDAIMGHVDNTMAAEYRETIDDARLLAVVNHVRSWLFPAAAEQPAAVGEPAADAAPNARLRIVG